MSMPKSLIHAINKTIMRYSEEDVCESRVDLALKCIRDYQAQFNYIPEEWLGYMREMSAKRMLWEYKLITLPGYTLREVKEMSFTELREAVEETEYVEVTTATATGGKSITRHQLKKAA